MTELPEGWAAARLGDVLRLINGFPFKPHQWSVRGKPIIRIQNLNNPAAAFNRFEGDLLPKFRVQNGDLLFAWSGTPGTSFGAHIWAGAAAWLNQHIFRVEFDDSMFDKRFLRLAINNNLSAYIEQAHGGAGLAHITKKKFEESFLVVPPLAEQRRIVEKVETLSRRVSVAANRLEVTRMRLQRVRESILNAARNGSWIGEHEEWDEYPCIDWCEAGRSLTYGVIKLGQAVEDGVPTLRSSDVRRLRIDSSTVKRISRSVANEYKRTFLRGGEIVVTVRGTLGGIAVVPPSMAGFNVSREVAVVPIDRRFSADFVALAIAAQVSQRWLRDVQKGVAYTGINIEDLKRLPIPRPPIGQQHAIAKRTKDLLAVVDSVEVRVSQAVTMTRKLWHSILSRAFAGELVPTEAEVARNERRGLEPASRLIERVRGEMERIPRRKRRDR